MRQRYLAEAMEQERLLLLCDTWPNEPFTNEKALTRNHTIYALGDAAVVVAARKGQGGTWNGASSCLRGGYTPVYAVDEHGVDFEGNHLLMERGASPIDLSKPIAAQLFPKKEGATWQNT